MPGEAGRLGEGRRKALRALLSRKGREKAGRYLLEGRRLVEEALAWDVPLAEAVVAPEAGEEIVDLARRLREAGVRVTEVGERDLRTLSDVVTPQGVLAVAHRETPPPVPREGLVVLLDAVQDPGNVGTLLRAADAFGAEAVLAARGTADVTSPKVLRAAMGSAFHLPVLRTGPSGEIAAGLASAGFTVLAATLDGEDPFVMETLPEKTLLVLGNEARGVHPAVLRSAHRRVTVPIPGDAESLNVAMAGAILLSDLNRLRAG
jgi:TrmH family RNA methyltransferase